MMGVMLALLLVLAGRALATFTVTFDGSATILNTGSISPNTPWGVVMDTSGNLYIGDTFNNQIIKIDATNKAPALTVTGVSPAMAGQHGQSLSGAVRAAGQRRLQYLARAGSRPSPH
jgi:hypothetical protein